MDMMCIDGHFPVLSYRMHGVQDLGELVKPPGAGGGVLPLAGNDTVKFLNVIHAELIEELLVLQAIHWNWVGWEGNGERNLESDNNRRGGGRLKQGTSPASWEVKVQAQGKNQMPQGQCSSRCWSSVEERVWVLTNTEEEESLHTEELLGCDLKPPKFLGEVPHPDALAVHPGFVHAVPGRVRWVQMTRRPKSTYVMGRALPDPANPPAWHIPLPRA